MVRLIISYRKTLMKLSLFHNINKFGTFGEKVPRMRIIVFITENEATYFI